METIITDKITFGGNCLSKIDGKNIFIPFAIPGEKLEIEITQSKRDYDYGKIVNILKASPYRVKPVCSLYEKCGGCNMMHIDSEYQKILRKEILKDCLERNGIKIKVEEIAVISDENLNYRARFQLNDGGLSARSSNEIIPLTKCACATDEINKWLTDVNFNSRPKGRCHIFGCENVISASGDLNKRVCIASEIKAAENNYDNLKKKNKNIKQIKKRYSGTSFSTSDIVEVEILGKKISFDVKGFFQSNLKVLEKAINAVTSGLFGNSVLDMYAGCGTFSLFLADRFKDLTLVEHNRDALVFAEKNLTGIKHQSIGLSGAKWALDNKNAYFDAVVIDPPRSGMEKEVLNWLCNSKVPQIRSVSCDPATHGRDLAQLVKAGYEIKKMYLLDFYPNTSHIESLAVLEKNPE